MASFRSGIPGIFLGLPANAAVANGGTIPLTSVEWSEQWGSAAGGIAVVPRSGTYEIVASYTRQALGVSSSSIISPRINGVDSLGGDRYPPSTAEIRGTVYALARLTAGDNIEVRAVNSNALTQTFTAGRTTLRIVRIGPERWT